MRPVSMEITATTGKASIAVWCGGSRVSQACIVVRPQGRLQGEGHQDKGLSNAACDPRSLCYLQPSETETETETETTTTAPLSSYSMTLGKFILKGSPRSRSTALSARISTFERAHDRVLDLVNPSGPYSPQATSQGLATIV